MSAPYINVLYEKWNLYESGSNDIIHELYELYYPNFIAYAYKHTRCKYLSEDVVSETIYKLLTLPNKERKRIVDVLKINALGFIMVMIKNKSIDHQRQKGNRFRLLTENIHKFTSFSRNNSENSFVNDTLAVLLNSLQPREREIFSLHMDGYSNDEIALQLKISYNTVKNNIYESRIKIKKKLDLI
ncbi:MAG: sigma-70 family RNA polymerase sigma factor [Bacteroidia bacterium]|nr:sigma-70 family RNA polymerase sigma factor [Bacteroidia bacterium]